MTCKDRVQTQVVHMTCTSDLQFGCPMVSLSVCSANGTSNEASTPTKTGDADGITLTLGAFTWMPGLSVELNYLCVSYSDGSTCK